MARTELAWQSLLADAALAWRPIGRLAPGAQPGPIDDIRMD